MDAISLTPETAQRTRPADRVCRGAVYVGEYAIEGGGSRNYIHTKQMMYGEPKVWHALMEKFSKVLTSYLRRDRSRCAGGAAL
ncbi:MAG: uroporphyrinogen decarboxylase family protein [Nitrospiraceae bacterium]